MTASLGRCSRTRSKRVDAIPAHAPGPGQRAGPGDDEVWPFLLGQLDDA